MLAENVDEAATVIFDGLDLNPNWTDGYLLLSRLYADPKKKIIFARQALASNVYNFAARENFANCLRLNSDLEYAKRIIDEGLQIWPFWGEGYAQYSHIYAVQGDIKAACSYAQKSVEVEPLNRSLRRHCEALMEILNSKDN